MNERIDTDPDNRYPTDGPRHVDKLAERVLRFLPDATIERTRDVIQVDWRGEEGIVVVVTPEALEFRLPTIEWTMGAYGPEESSRFWKRVESEALDDSQLGGSRQTCKSRPSSSVSDLPFLRRTIPSGAPSRRRRLPRLCGETSWNRILAGDDDPGLLVRRIGIWNFLRFSRRPDANYWRAPGTHVNRCEPESGIIET